MTSNKSNMQSQYSPISRLIQIGRKKTYITINDILEFFPDAEKKMLNNLKKHLQR